MKTNPIDIVLEKEKFNEDEKQAFKDVIKYAKLCQQGLEDNLKPYINLKIEEVIKK